MQFDFNTSGLTAKKEWIAAAKACEAWLAENMTMFNKERQIAFMHNQPVAAAKRIFDNCDNVSNECVTLLLLGPAKDQLLGSAAVESRSRSLFGDRTIDLLKRLYDANQPSGQQMDRDVARIILAEGVSGMNDQLIGRKRRDMHHPVRWNMLLQLEAQAKALAGPDPKLDKIVSESLAQARASLEALDAAAAAKKAPKPPGF